MDVTSMLNQGAAAARREAREGSDPTPAPSVVDGTTVCSSAVQTPSPEQTPSRRTSDSSRTPNRARTPWDAGGYSLPLTLDTKTVTQSHVKPAFYNESPLDSASPKSPKHKFSDSYSSLSSYTSSLNSVSHSRFSSLSTVSGFQSIPPLITDMSTLESRASDNLDSAISRSSVADYFGKRPRKDGGASPTTIAEEPSAGNVRRPGSPSDAMLIRGSISSDRMSPQEFVNPDSKPASGFLALPDLAKSHKRAISAPDITALSVAEQPYSSIPQNFQPTPPPSHQGDRRASYMMEALSASPTAPNVVSIEEGIKCMYVDNCDTGSQPRKAISHIFGRNKLCTRMIPSHVWVHFCRKHYQRSRYRNAQEYSKLQCELVQKQIQRVQAWSDSNKQAGRSGVVQDWSLSVRKREQKRLDDQTSSSKKRRFRDESEEEDNDAAVLNGTAVPNWLLTKCNSGYSTAQIEEIVAQLKLEMDEGKLAQIPDIEILPNISTDSEDGKNKVVIKRKSSAGSGAHKRSQSVGFAQGVRHDVTPMMRRVSQPGFAGDWSPIEKRQRTHTLSPYGLIDRQNQRGSLSQVPERGVPMMGPTQHTVLPHRPASYSYNNIRENPIEEAYYDDAAARNGQYTYGGPLPAPAPQRLGQPMAAQLEANNAPQGYFDVRARPMHQRAHSEMGVFNHDPSFTFRSSSMAYPSAPHGYSQEPMPYETYPPPTYGTTGGPPGYYDDIAVNRTYASQQLWSAPAAANPSPYAMPRHTRHQSTSAVPQAIPRLGPSDEMYGSMGNSPGRFDGQQSHHRRQYSYTPSHTISPDVQRLQETDHTKALFRERR